MQDSGKDSSSQADMSKLLADQSFVSSILASVCLLHFLFIFFCPYTQVLSSENKRSFNAKLFLVQLPGVDPNDPSVKEVLASMQTQSEVSSLNLVAG